MKDEEINIAIAKSRGWTDIHQAANTDWMGVPPKSKDSGVIFGLPCYTKDLNAMHKAEKSLNNEQWKHYTEVLQLDAYNTATRYWEIDMFLVHATSRQRAEAYLRVIGKWVNDE